MAPWVRTFNVYVCASRTIVLGPAQLKPPIMRMLGSMCVRVGYASIGWTSDVWRTGRRQLGLGAKTSRYGSNPLSLCEAGDRRNPDRMVITTHKELPEGLVLACFLPTFGIVK